MTGAPIIVAVMAHNEERRIARCLSSLPLGDPRVAVHAVVNGSRDRTAEIARGFARVTVHEYAEGGKSRSWNRFALDTPGIAGEVFVFVDGDAEVAPGSVFALHAALMADPAANAAAGLPCNGRKVQAYRRQMVADHGLFGDLYALRGSFVERMRSEAIRLPEDLVGEDGLLCALAKTGLADEGDWQNARVLSCPDAGFFCEPASLFAPATLVGQYRRMINYSVRHFQNRMISAIMRREGPSGFPQRLSALHADWLPRLAPRRHPLWWWFDRQALARMARMPA